MPKHTPRTIWKPVGISVLSLSEGSAPAVENFSSIRSIDADATQGLSIKHLQVVVSMGLVEDTLTTNIHCVSGILGLFKWPADAATPTASTIDLLNRTKVFARRQWVLQGSIPRVYTVNVKSVRLTLGEELWVFTQKLFETHTTLIYTSQGRASHYESPA